MRPLTDKQLDDINKIIEDHTSVLGSVFNGSRVKNRNLLLELGFDPDDPSFLQQAYALGKLRETTQKTAVDNMSFKQLSDTLKKLPLTATEKEAFDYASRQAGKHVTNAERKIQLQIEDSNNRIGLKTMMEKDAIGQTVAEGIKRRQTRGELVSELGHVTEDWTRDWERVANTELWGARQQATARQIIQGDSIYSTMKGKAAKVFIRPAADACRHCKRLYLEKDGTTPKVFYLHELIANGTNVGLKVAEWKPIIPPLHPHCVCPIEAMPEGFKFDKETGDLVPE